MAVANNLDFYSKLLDDLKTYENENPDEDLDAYRRKVCGLKNSDAESDAVPSESSEQNDNLVRFRQDLDENCQLEVTEKICKLIAELAKDETCRDKFVERGFLNIINRHLEESLNKPLEDTKNMLLKIQICRAIGNLCYCNDTGRMSFFDSNGEKGVQNLVGLCEECTRLNVIDASEQDRTLVSVVLGCIHNLTNENETLRKAVYATPIMSLVKQLVPFLKSSHAVRVHFVSLIENLIELDEGKKLFVSEQLALKLYESLDQEFVDSLDQDYFEEFFDFLSTINELEKSKDYLYQTEFLQIVLNTAEKHVNEEETMRHFGLFLVKLVVQDENIDAIFAYKNGLVLNTSIEWLSKFKSEQLYVTTAVIMANYMRSDEKVMELMRHKSEPHKKLANILSTYSKLAKTATMQQINVSHSLLGSLRNFCVCQSGRETILSIEPHVVDIAMRFILDSDNYEILFKSLSIVRFLIRTCTLNNGLEAIFAETSLQRFEELNSSVEHHAGVCNELSRLLCLLPLAGASRAENRRLFDRLARQLKIVHIICNQLASEHFIMLNEALIAVNVLVAVDYKSFRDHLKSSSLDTNLKSLFKNEKLPIEMKINSLKLFKTLYDKSDFFTEQQLVEYLEKLKQLKLLITTDFLRTQIDQLINSLENATV